MNSVLTDMIVISPNKTSPRNHKIDTITIHCMVAQWTAEQACNYFFNRSISAAPNYVVGCDGKVGVCVNEEDRSWCSSNKDNDHRAITIEVASETSSPYKVRPVAYSKLIELVADICQRNGITELIWSFSKEDRVNHKNGCNMTVHRDFANKSCPGEYLYNLMPDIAKSVNKLLSGKQSFTEKSNLYRVQVGAFSNKENAERQLKKLKEAGFEGYIRQ